MSTLENLMVMYPELSFKFKFYGPTTDDSDAVPLYALRVYERNSFILESYSHKVSQLCGEVMKRLGQEY